MAQPFQPMQPVPVPVADGPAPGVRFAKPVPRLIGYVIDGFIAGVASIAVMFVFGTIAGIAGAAGMNFIASLGIVISILAVFAVMLLYSPYFWVKREGQTPGMKVMHIRVVRDEDGGPIGWGSAIMRLIGYWISGAVFYIGYVWILVDKRKRGWFDLMAGTCVVEV